MNIGSTDYAAQLEQAQQAAEAARKKAEEARANAEKEQSEAQQANADVDSANANVVSQQSIYTQAGDKLNLKKAELQNALAALEAVSAGEDEAAIANAQELVAKIEQELAELEREVQAEYDELLRLQQDAQTALKRAEIEQKEADESVKELEIAEQELIAAEEALKEAEAAAEAAAAEEAKLEKEVSQLTEQEAIEQGYTIIKTAEDLQAVANNLSGKYILMNDIDLSGIEWKPIGTMDPTSYDPWAGAFKGEFNGNGFTIRNLTVAADENDTGVGLFGATDGANISNVVLEDANVSAPVDEYNEVAVGGLIGVSRDTNIDNVTVSGEIAGHQGVGGLIGVIDDSQLYGMTTISNVNTNVNVHSEFYAGGLIGKVEDTAQNSLVLENCHTEGNVVVNDSCAGGLIGEAGKTVITVNRCSSSMNISRESNLPSELSWLLDTSRIGGIIGNCNGTYISICNSEFTGTLNSDDEFKGEHYGYYMNDAQVSIFELEAGLPVDDILNIEGISEIIPKIDPETGVAHYEVTVSTLAGMNRLVDMIQNNPKLADLITFNIQYDFETMDEVYENSDYPQYGVVQHIYQDAEGNTINDVYIDNEVDLETAFNTGYAVIPISTPVEVEIAPRPDKTMVAGLYKDDEGKYYVFTGTGEGKFPGYTEVTLRFFFENKANVTTRLDADEVHLRDELVNYARNRQFEMQSALAEKYGYEVSDLSQFIIQEPEYKALKKKEALGQTLTDDEKLKIELYELNYKIANIFGEITKNEGCGMGGNASFLEKTTGIPMEDEWGRIRYMTLDGLELRQKVDENGEYVLDDNGKPVYETLEGEEYDWSSGEPYIVRGYPITNENGDFLYTDENGNTVVRSEDENGNHTYAYEDGTAYEGNPEDLTQQLEERTPKQMLDELDEKLGALETETFGETSEADDDKKKGDEEETV